ncbi:MAG TPA: MauE/DoxX family redox-associated membrane protein [Solirubrobacteraceae bacterium]|nr:MauE/DoxX family redox-associated membrane protein [Solirubrobacteraceae bacterium]
MLETVLRCVPAVVLLSAAAMKLRRPAASRDALATMLPGPMARGGGPAVAWTALVALEIGLGAGVAAGSQAAALAAAALMAAFAAALARALAKGWAGTPCGCFGARSTVSRAAVVRALALAAAFAAVPFIPEVDPSPVAWLAAGLALALVGMALLAVAMLALAREVGSLRLALGPQQALELTGEGPPLGADAGLRNAFDPRPGAQLALAVFTSEACHLCQALRPAVASLARDPHVTVAVFDEVEHADAWRALAIPGSPYAIALDADGLVRAKGTFNTLAQLESVLATAERRLSSSTSAAHD